MAVLAAMILAWLSMVERPATPIATPTASAANDMPAPIGERADAEARRSIARATKVLEQIAPEGGSATAGRWRLEQPTHAADVLRIEAPATRLEVRAVGAAPVPAVTDGTGTAYMGAWSGVDVVHRPGADSFKEGLVLHGPRSRHEFHWKVAARDKERMVLRADGSIGFRAADGAWRPVRVPAPIGIDGADRRIEGAQLRWLVRGDLLTLRYAPTADVRYPVVLDPTFTNGQAADKVIGSGMTWAANRWNGRGEEGLQGAYALASNGTDLWVANASDVVRRYASVPTTNLAPRTQVLTGMTQPHGIWTNGTKAIGVDKVGHRVYLWNSNPPNGSAPPAVVLGQSTVGNNEPNAGGISASSLFSPRGVWSDGTRIVITDESNHRVLIWNSWPTTNQQPADLVLGQTSFANNVCNSGGRSASTVCTPRGVWSNGTRLYVADSSNHRVLVWDTFPTTNGQAANFVLGQPNFTTAAANSAAMPSVKARLNNPFGLGGDAGHLYVTDEGNHRVRIWNTSTPTAGQAADVLLNTAGTAGTGPATFWGPSGVISVGGKLVVSDSTNSRALVWNTIPTADDAPADVVIGQAGMQDNGTFGNVGDAFFYADDVAFDSAGDLWTASSDDAKLLRWDTSSPTFPALGAIAAYDATSPRAGNRPPPSGYGADRLPSYRFKSIEFAPNGRMLLAHGNRVTWWNSRPTTDPPPAFNGVLGQANLTANLANRGTLVGADTLLDPRGVATDGTRVAVADYDNNRVLIWNSMPASGAPADVVLGQDGFATNSPNLGGISAETLARPTRVVIADGRLFVLDTGNNRLLIWNSIPTASGTPASIVLGQQTMFTSSAATNASGLNQAAGMDIDDGMLVVADTSNHRVLIWDTVPTASGTPADRVLGKANLTSSTPNTPSQTVTQTPRSVTIKDGRVAVADYAGSRVMIWDDVAAPQILGLKEVVAGDRATVSFTTDEDATSELMWDTVSHPDGTGYPSSVTGPQKRGHGLVMNPLVVGATYYYRVRAIDSRGNVTLSPERQLISQNTTRFEAARSFTGDATILAQQPTFNYGGATTLQVGGGPGGAARSLVRFDVSQIPTNAVVTSARLVMTTTATGSTQGLEAFQLDRAFTEGDADGIASPEGTSWNSPTGIDSWTTAGGDLTPAPARPATVGAANGATADFDVTDAVQEWVASPVANLGMLVRATTETSVGARRAFASSEHADVTRRPVLVVQWTGADAKGPRIADVQVELLSSSSARITWSTDETADERLDYGTTTAYGTTLTSSVGSNYHSMVLENLTPNTEYHFRIRATDARGNSSVSSDRIFLTNYRLTMPVTDTFVRQDMPDRNMGRQPSLYAGSTTTWQKARAMLRFDISSLPPGARIQSAKMEVTVAGESNAATPSFRLDRLTTPFTEGTGAPTISPRSEMLANTSTMDPDPLLVPNERHVVLTPNGWLNVVPRPDTWSSTFVMSRRNYDGTQFSGDISFASTGGWGKQGTSLALDGATLWSVGLQDNATTAQVRSYNAATGNQNLYGTFAFPAGFTHSPGMALDTTGRLWLKAESLDGRIAVVRSTNPRSPAAWGTATVVTTQAAPGHAQLVPTTGGRMVLLSQDGGTLSSFIGNGTTWTTPTVVAGSVATPSPWQSRVSFASVDTPTGDVWASWLTTGGAVSAAKFDGTSWGSAQPVATGATAIAMSLNRNGQRPYVFWQAGTQLRSSYRDGAAWTSPQTHAGVTLPASATQLTVSPPSDEALGVAWTKPISSSSRQVWWTGFSLPRPADGATWATSDGATAWSTGGGDVDAGAPIDVKTVPTGVGKVVQFDATAQTRRWYAGDDPNHGVLLRAQTETGDDWKSFYSKDSPNVGLRPRLIVDYDLSSIAITPVTGMRVDEDDPDAPGTISVVLRSAPTDAVRVRLESDDQVTLSRTELVFTQANWNVPQTAEVTAVDDDVDEDDVHPAVVTSTVVSLGDPGYDAFPLEDVTVDVGDDDDSVVVFEESDDRTQVDEAGVTDTYQLRLGARPRNPVTITIASGPQAVALPATVTFEPSEWNTPRTITVTGMPDDLVEGDHEQLLTHTATSPDVRFQAMVAQALTVHVVDDDVAGIEIDPTSVQVGEDGTTGTYRVRLKRQPSHDVVVAIEGDDQVTVSPQSLTFTQTTWNDWQDVVVAAVDDDVVEDSPHPGVVTHEVTSDQDDFDEIPADDVLVDIEDDDEPGVVVLPTTLTVTEGAAAPHPSFTVQLASRPRHPVELRFGSDAQLASIAAITIQPADWETPVTIPVVALDDAIAELPIEAVVTVDTDSLDDDYRLGEVVVDPVSVSVLDDDVAGVELTPATGLAGDEGDLVGWKVQLTSEPTAPVTIELDDDADGDVEPAGVTELTFTPDDWDAPQQVDLRIVQDDIAEGAHTTTLRHDVRSSDAIYDLLATIDQVVDVTDDDEAGIVLTPAAPVALSLGEGGADASYELSLRSRPLEPVDVALTVPGGQAVVDRAVVTFEPEDWNDPVIVRVEAVDDDIDEADVHTDVVQHAATSDDPTYEGPDLPDELLEIADDDEAGVLLEHVGPDTRVTEQGSGDLVRVRLTSRPLGPVTVTLTGVQVEASPTTVVIQPDDWDDAVEVPVAAVDDAIAEGDHAGTLLATSASAGDAGYEALTTPVLDVQVFDDDVVGVIVAQPIDPALDEDTPLTAKPYTVRLRSEPTAPVTVTLQPDAQVTVGTPSIEIAPADWDVPVPVDVAPVDDDVAEDDPHPGRVVHAIGSADTAYDGLTGVTNAEYQIAENDIPGIEILPDPTVAHIVAEGGATSTYTIRLTSRPSAPVTVRPVSGQLEWSVASLEFTTTNWADPQTVTLRAIDDDIDEPDVASATLEHALESTDVDFDDLDVATISADVTDNDDSDLVVDPIGLVLDEASVATSATYRVRLTSRPSAPVTIRPALDANVTIAPATIVLDTATWSSGADIVVTVVDDDVDEDDVHQVRLAHALDSTDPSYGGETGPEQVIDISDDDAAGVLVTQTGAGTSVDEDAAAPDATDGYDVVLASRPTHEVVVTVLADGQLVTTPAQLRFTPDVWDVPQRVEIAAFDDEVQEAPVHPGTITHTVTSDDARYAGLTPLPGVAVDVHDDDVASINLVADGGSLDVAEAGATDTVTITLGSRPTHAVTLTFVADADVTVAPASVTIQPEDWATPIPITIGAVDDSLVERAHTGGVTVTAASDDPFYAVDPADLVATIVDNDVATVQVVESDDATAVDEADATDVDVVEYVLTAEPTAPVTVRLTADDQVTVTPTVIERDASNWDEPVEVEVAAVDDDIDEDDIHAGAIDAEIETTDPEFASAAPAQLGVDVADDDPAGFDVLPSATPTVTEGGTGTALQVQLRSRPTAPVVLAFTVDDQLKATPGSVTIQPSDWAAPVSIQLDAIDDDVDEASPHPGSITVAVDPATTDARYVALPSLARNVDVVDDDEAAVLVSPATSPDLREGDPVAGAATLQVRLGSRPLAPVTVSFLPDMQLALDAATITIAPDAWDQPHPLVVAAVDDAIDEPDPQSGLLAWTASGDDTYEALAGSSRTFTIIDDDTAGIELEPAPDWTIAEDGSTVATYGLRLRSQPLLPVTVRFEAADGQMQAPAPITIDPAMWNQRVDVVVRAVDDDVTEATPHDGVLHHVVESIDPAYGLGSTVTIADVTARITDDDIGGWSLTPAGGVVVEENEAGSATYLLVPTSRPASPITVELAPRDGQVSVSPATHTFQPATWDTPVTVTVTAIDDDVDEADEHEDAVQHTVAPGSDSVYAGIALPQQPVGILDDDTVSVRLLETDDSTSVDEAQVATRDAFDVVLGSRPAGPVTVTLAHDGDIELDRTLLTIEPADWNAPQRIQVAAVDDDADEADIEQSPVVATITSADAAYAAVIPDPVQVDVHDDDTAALVAAPSAALTSAEAGETVQQVEITLASRPWAPVDIRVETDEQLTSDRDVIRIEPADWNTPVTLELRAIDDDVDEASPHDGIATLTVDGATSDQPYLDLPALPLTVAITDDDEAGIEFAPDAEDELQEADSAGTSRTYAVRLTSRPRAAVVIAPIVDAQLEVDTASLTFEPDAWNDAQDVTITAVDDDIDEADVHEGVLAWEVTGDAQYVALAPAAVDVDVRDDDSASLDVDPAGPVELREGSVPVPVTVRLGSRPAGPVTIEVDAGDQVEVAPAKVIVDPERWADPVVFTIVAVDDDIDEVSPLAAQLAFEVSSTDGMYAALAPAPVDLSILDDDEAGVTVITPDQADLALAEAGGSASVQVQLTSRPTQPVRVVLAADDQLATSVAERVIQPSDWQVPVEVSVTAVDDALIEGDHDGVLQIDVGSSDDAYAAITLDDVVAHITDDDLAGVLVSPSTPASVTEGGAPTTLAIRLSARPNSAVTVRFAPDAQTKVEPAELVFDGSNWDAPRDLVVTAVDDAVAEASTESSIAVDTSSDQGAFDELDVTPIAVEVLDDDELGVAFVAADPILLDEATRDTGGEVRVQLTSQPTAPVRVVLQDATGQLVAAPEALEFTPDNWSTPQVVSVRPIDDELTEPNPHLALLLPRTESGDGDYDALPLAPLKAQITDNDVARLDLLPGAGWTPDATSPVRLVEGASATASIRISSSPAMPVTITPTVAPGAQLRVEPASHTFEAGSPAQAAAEFTVTAIDDDVDEADPHASSVTWTVATQDPSYVGVVVAPTAVEIADDDEVGIVLAPATKLTAAEGGNATSVDVSLASAPTRTVFLELVADEQTSASAIGARVRFDADTWDTPQTITVGAVDDAVTEPSPHPGVVRLDPDTVDPGYRALEPVAIDVDITDNDEPRVLLIPSGADTRVREGADVDGFELRLATRPTAAVRLTLAPDQQVTFEPATITIEPAAWDTPQRIVVQAVQDDLLEGEHSARASFTMDSTDPAYAATSASRPADHPVVVEDDEQAGLVLTQTAGLTEVAEGGATDSYTVSLAARPVADVTVQLEPDAQVSVEPAQLTFRAQSWNVAQEVVVTAVQDDIAEPDPHPGAIRHRVTTSAAGWTDAAEQSIGVRVKDDDTASIRFAATGATTTVTEGGSGDEVELQLTSQPSSAVTVTARPDDQTTVGEPVTIAPADWKRPARLKLEAVDDEDVEGRHASSITFTVMSGDGSYTNQAIPALDAIVEDNDAEDDSLEEELEDDEAPESTIPPPPVPQATVAPPESGRDRQPNARTPRGTTRTDRIPPPVIRRPPERPRATPPPGRTTIDGERVASRDEQEQPVQRLLGWLGDHRLITAILAGLALLGIGVGTMWMRDPLRAARRSAGARGATSAAHTATRHGVRRLRRGRRRRSDDEDEDGESS